MWRLSVLPVVVALLMTANCSNGVGQAQEPKDGKREESSAKANRAAHGLELSVHAPESTRLGEPVYLWLVLKNRTKRAQTVPRLDPRYRSPSVDLHGTAIEISPVGGAPVRIEVPAERAAPMRVAAGQAESVKVPVHITYRGSEPNWWLREPGKYTVSVQYGFRAGEEAARLDGTAT
ncbi:MAG: hypothetical protein V3T86_06350, partial [Planctomycetota bacterium]